MAELKDLIVQGSSRFIGPILGKISSADTAENCPKYLPLAGGILTGNLTLSADTFGLPKGSSHTGMVNWTSANGFQNNASFTGPEFLGNIYNISYTFACKDARIQDTLYANTGCVQSVHFNYATGDTLYAKTVSLDSNSGYLSSPTGSFTTIYGRLYGTADSANNCPNYLPLAGNSSSTSMSGSVYVDGYSWTIKSANYMQSEFGFSSGSFIVRPKDDRTYYVTSSSHQSSTLAGATISSQDGCTLMDAYAIRQYVESACTNTITITI